MNAKTIRNVMRLFITFLAIMGLIFYAYAVPVLGKSLANAYPEFAHCYYPWLVFISVTGIPCYIVLVELWKVSLLVGEEAVFSKEAAKLFNNISLLAAIDILFFFIMNVAFMFVRMNHPSILIASVVISVIGIGFSFCAKVVSEYVGQAAKLQEENDLTI